MLTSIFPASSATLRHIFLSRSWRFDIFFFFDYFDNIRFLALADDATLISAALPLIINNAIEMPDAAMLRY